MDGPVDCRVLKEAFLDRFFTLQWRDKNIVEFMNLRQGGISHPRLPPRCNRRRRPFQGLILASLSRVITFIG